MKIIHANQGKEILVSDEDYENLIQYHWYVIKPQKIWYAVRHEGKGKNRHDVRMHRQILNAPKHLEVDHINGDGLDNQRTNLRLATHTENSRNKKKFGIGIYKGVHITASIQVDKKQIQLGTFATAEEAALAYDEAALEYFGKFAKTNF